MKITRAKYDAAKVLYEASVHAHKSADIIHDELIYLTGATENGMLAEAAYGRYEKTFAQAMRDEGITIKK